MQTRINTWLALFLSPHFDDIALSCGGMAARLSQAGARCIGLTVCAAPAPADAPISEFTQGLHSRWQGAAGGTAAGGAGSTEQAANDLRRQEEQSALALLGLKPVWLDIPDAIYRRGSHDQHLYTSDEALFGEVAPEERKTLVPLIAGEVKRIVEESGARGRVRLFAPLGVGHHVDHQLVFLAVRRLGPRYGVLFYEDYPYASVPGALEARIGELRLPMQPRLTSIDDLLPVKVAAIGRYRSQLEVLFGEAEAMPDAVRTYARQVASGSGDIEYGERYWYIPPVHVMGR